MATIIFALLFGAILGLGLAFFSLYLIKVNCPKCKKPQPIWEIIIFDWKTWMIAGQPCRRCQEAQLDQLDIF